MNTFTPQLSQQDLAEMIDREGLQFQALMECANGANPYTHDTTFGNAQKHIGHGIRIRLAPGALTEFGLKPGMVPHNPDSLTAEQITEGGKYRAWSVIEFEAAKSLRVHQTIPGMQMWFDCYDKQWGGGEYGGYGDESTYRVPINTPFPKPSRTEPPAEQSSVTQQAEPNAEDGCMANDDQWTPPE